MVSKNLYAFYDWPFPALLGQQKTNVSFFQRRFLWAVCGSSNIDAFLHMIGPFRWYLWSLSLLYQWSFYINISVIKKSQCSREDFLVCAVLLLERWSVIFRHALSNTSTTSKSFSTTFHAAYCCTAIVEIVSADEYIPSFILKTSISGL